jgi:G:T-mismatch repair DNA endonuclease (very short patch repair protein)
MGKPAKTKLSLAEANPALAEQWHPTKNGDLTPHDVSPKSGYKAFWVCPEGHESEAFIFARNKGQKCGYCSGRYATPENNLAARYPEIAAQWHPTKNALKPYEVMPGSLAEHFWLCDKGHDWAARVGARTAKRSSGCPVCANHLATPENSIEALRPDLAALWHPTKNGDVTPHDITPGSNLRKWWECEVGHDFQKTVFAMAAFPSCPKCTRKIASPETSIVATNPELLSEWNYERNQDVLPEQVLSGARRKVWWRCKRSHEWKASVCNRAGGARSGCPDCPKFTSKPEAALSKLLSYVMNVDVDHPSIVAGGRKQACDIVVPDRKLVVEYDGCYWHKDKETHDLAKTLALNDAGWKVIRVRETPLEKLTGRDVLIKPNDVDAAFTAICRMLRISAKDRDRALRMAKAALN